MMYQIMLAIPNAVTLRVCVAAVLSTVLYSVAACTSCHRDFDPPNHRAPDPPNMDISDDLISKLEHLSVDGFSMGGPHVVLVSNEVTSQIVKIGPPIIPKLIKNLDNTSMISVMYTVWCLNEMKAKSAKPSIVYLNKRLDAGELFPGVKRDIALNSQIIYI